MSDGGGDIGFSISLGVMLVFLTWSNVGLFKSRKLVTCQPEIM